MRDICEILGVNRSSLYYHPQEDPSEAVLLAEIEKLSGQYPRYRYRRITQVLRRQGYTVGTRRVARLMKEKNLLVPLKRVSGQTTKSLQGDKPWSNLLEDLEVSHPDQVWVADITYVSSSQISPKSLEYKTTGVQVGEEPEQASYLLEKGDVVISMSIPDRHAVALLKTDGVVGSRDLVVLRASRITPEYLFAFCKTDYFGNCLRRANKGSFSPAVSMTDVLDTALFVPSDPFEDLIAKTVKASIVENERAQQMHTEAESVLLSEIGLTDWEPKSRLTFVKNFSDMQRAGRMDSDFFQPRYEAVVNAIRNYPGGSATLGDLVTLKQGVAVEELQILEAGIPFVRVSDLAPYEVTEKKYISEERYADMREYQPQKGDILLSKDGTPGIAYYVHSRPKRMIPSREILILKSDTDTVGNESLTLILNSILTQEQVHRDVAGSSSIRRWRPDQVAAIRIPLLSREKQVEIQHRRSESSQLRHRSKKLLENAKAAVEIAIDHDERTASNWLESAQRYTL